MEQQLDGDDSQRLPTSPALAPAVAALIGAAWGLQAQCFDVRLLVVLGLLALAWAVSFRRRQGWWLLALVIGASSGGLETARLLQGGEPEAGKPVEIVGQLRSAWTVDAGDPGGGWWVELRDVRWSRPVAGRSGHLAGRFVLAIPGTGEPPVAGAVRVRGLLRQLREPRNGLPPPPKGWRLTLASRRMLQVEAPPPPWMRWSSRWRQAVEDVWRSVEPEGQLQGTVSPGFALTRALLLGDRSQLAPEWQRALRRLGLAHVLAVSGLHVGLVAGLVWLAGMPLPRGLRLLLPLLAVLGYALLVGPRPSLLRAAAMGLLVCVSLYLRRPPIAVHGLALFVLVLTLINPTIVFDLGFQLSVSATAGILILGPSLARRWTLLPAGWRLPLAASVGAQLASLPIALPAFHLLPLAAPLVNLLVVPWVAVMLMLGGLWTALAFAVPSELAHSLLTLLDLAALPLDALAALPPDGWTTWPVVVSVPTAVFASTLLLVLLRAPRPWAVAALAAAGVIWAWSGPEPGVPVPWNSSVASPTLEVLDVGQGDALLLRAGRRAVLVDGGGWRRGDLAGRVLVPALARRGVRRLEAILITHPDQDHCGGAEQLADYLPVGQVWLASGVSRADCIQGLVQRRGLPVHLMAAGQSRSLGAWRLRFQHPGKLRSASGHASETGTSNDRSIVVRAEAFDRCLLLTGDLEADGEQELRRRWRQAAEETACDVLKVPHHGSRTSSTPGLLHDLGARWALLSVGADNRYGHPHPSVVRRLRGYGLRVLRTDLHGAITLRVGPQGELAVHTEHSPGLSGQVSHAEGRITDR